MGLPNHDDLLFFSGSSRQDFATFQSYTYKSTVVPKYFQKIKYDKLLSTPLLASNIIAVIVKNTEYAKIPFLEEIVAVSCSVQNIVVCSRKKILQFTDNWRCNLF